MSLMDELVSAGVDSNEFLGNPMNHEDFVATNNLDDSSLSHSLCEDFTVDLTDMKNIYAGGKYKDLYGNVDTTNKNNSGLFENCAMNLDQELEQAVTLTGSPMATTVSNQEKFPEPNLESNSLNRRQEHMHAMSQLTEQDINQIEVEETTTKIPSLEEELSQAFSLRSKPCDIVEMNESNSHNYHSYNEDQNDYSIRNYDDSINNCDSEDTSNYESRIRKVQDIDADNYNSDIKDYGDNDIVNEDVGIKDHHTDDVSIKDHVTDVSIKGHVTNDISIKDHVTDDISIKDHVTDDISIKDHVSDDISIKDHVSDDISIKDHVTDDISIKDHVTDDIVYYFRDNKCQENSEINYFDNSIKSHVNDDDVDYNSDIKSYDNNNVNTGHSNSSIKDHDDDNIDNYITNNNDNYGDNEIDNNYINDNYAANNNNDDGHGHNEMANNYNDDHGDDSSKSLCENLVEKYDIGAESDNSSIVNNFSPERNMGKECTLIKDEIKNGNSSESHFIDRETTELSAEVAIDVDEIKRESATKNDIDVDEIKRESATKTDIDVDEIKRESATKTDIDVDMLTSKSPTEIDMDVDIIMAKSPVKDSNIKNSSAAEETLNVSMKTEPIDKTTVYSNNEDSVTMSSMETSHTNKSGIEESALDSQQLEDCETFEDLFHKEKFLKNEREVESLTKQLNDKQKVIHQAVNFGKQLLEENEELKEKVDKLEQKTVTIEEELKNEKHSSKLKLDSKEYMEKQYNEEISLLQNEVTQLKKEVQSFKKQEANLNRELRNKDDLLEQSNLKEEQLTTTIKNLEKLLLKKTEEVVHYPSQSLCDDDEQQRALENEVSELQTECTNLKSQLISSHANTNRMEEELARVKRRLDEKQQEYEEIRSEMNSYQKTLEISQREILDLKAQLYAAQVENMNRQGRGNSLFSEVEDRRISVEKTLMILQENYQVLKEKYNLEKQQNYKLKMQMMSLYQMNSSKGNETELEYLNCKLSQSQHEMKQLQERIKSLEKQESQQIDKLTDIQKTFGTKENQGLIDFLKSLNDKKQNDLKTTQVKLNNLEMQYIQETDKVVNYMKKLRQAEEKIESLGYSNMKLKLQIDELITKYKPDEIGNVKNARKTRTEKIPLGSSENIPEKLKSEKEPCKLEVKIPAENQSKTTHRRKLELARYGFINPIDFLDGSPKAKKTVSMSNDVEIIDQDGNQEQKLASTPLAKSQQTKKSKGKLAPRNKVIEVKAPPETNAMECAQQ